jgi:phospholipid/cholesterol/gamma-HCH transport system ATP-binding protein
MYFIHDGVVAGAGTVEEMTNSQDPAIYQFMRARPDGPIAFQYPSKPYAEDLNIKA